MLGLAAGLVPQLSIGALFAQGVLWQPGAGPVVPAAPASQFSYLGYNSSTGLYWTVNPDGDTAGDAVLGWVETDATDLIAVSNQQILVAASDSSSGGSGAGSSGVQAVGGSPFGGTGGGLSTFGGIHTMTVDASWNVQPDGITGAFGQYFETSTDPIHVNDPINMLPGFVFAVTIFQGATGRAVSWGSAYKGISEFEVDARADSFASVMFQVQADGNCLLMFVPMNGVLRA